METDVQKEKRPRGAPRGRRKPERPVMAVRVDAGVRDQIVKVAQLSNTTPSRLMDRILTEAMTPK